MPSPNHLFDKIDDMMLDDKNEEIKKLENIINDLTLTVGMYIHNYSFDDNQKAKQQMLVNHAHVAIGTPINDRGMAKSVGIDCTARGLVEIVITEDEAKQVADVLFYLIDKCNYSNETEHALVCINNQIHNQIEYEPSK